MNNILILNNTTEIESGDAMVAEGLETLGEIIEETKEVVLNPYNLRPLVATDMGAICKIITAIGIRQLKECFKVEDFQSGNIEQVGFSVLFDIAGIIISNIPKAEEEIQAFIASLTGMKLAEVKAMPFADYGELIIKVVTNGDFQDFFKRVMKLFNR